MIPYMLAASLIILLVISYYGSGKEIAAPEIGFLAIFSLAAIDLIYNITKWNVKLTMTTYWVIVGGSLCLLLGICLYKYSKIIIRFERYGNGNLRIKKTVINPVEIDKKKYILFALLQALTFILCLRGVISIARRYGVAGSISVMIAGYKNLKTFSTYDVSLGTINNFLYDFCFSSGYIWAYIIANNAIIKKQFNKLAFLNFVLSLAISLEKGSRGNAVALLFSSVAMFIILWTKISKRGYLSLKQIILLIAIAILVVGSFQWVGELLGRVSKADFGGYLAVYLSAPIQNLNEYLKINHSPPDIFGKMTFVRMINYLCHEFNISEWVYELDLPKRYANGFVTGNVYTTFYAYVYDFGFIGVPLLMTIMGLISEWLYFKALRLKQTKEYSINIWFLVYCEVYYMLAFSFFSNKFFEGVISIQFYKYLIYWAVIRYFLEKVKVKL